MPKIRVMIAEDHELMRDGLRVLLRTQTDMAVVAEAKDGEETLRLARETIPEVLLLDLSMPKLTGEEVVINLLDQHPQIKVLVVSGASEQTRIEQLRSLGVSGYISKHIGFNQLSNAIRRVARGEKVFIYNTNSIQSRSVSLLSHKEIEIFKLIARGHTNGEIAQRLQLSIKTIESQKSRICEKVGIKTRAEFFNYALKRGWLFENIL